jgi:hypothetical protein
MSKIHLIIPDSHAHPEHNNDRADWLGKLIVDLKPDVVVNLGDMFDLPSFSGYDKGKARFHGRAYRKDLDAGLEFDDRLWAPIRKAKKRKPLSIFCEGNHEERMKRALDHQPELEGTIGFKDFQLDKNYNEIVEYKGQTPGTIEVDGITYAHYFITGVSGRNVSGEHPAYSLLTKQFQSATCGHIHTFDYSIRTDAKGRRLHGLVAGVYQDYESDWAGDINKLWSRGIVIKRNVEKGNYDLQWVSLEALKAEYNV